ncbi:hypothetical protein K2P56_04905 [Patescibacteria group bacterium]|nr:hypothetical protein [Patescibacteria group bacterium]
MNLFEMRYGIAPKILSADSFLKKSVRNNVSTHLLFGARKFFFHSLNLIWKDILNHVRN